LACEGGDQSYCSPSGNASTAEVFHVVLALYKDDDCDDDDNIQNVIGYALGYCDVDNDEGTSEKLVKVDGKFVSNKYATDDCSGNVMEADTFVDGVCRSFGDLKVSTTVYTLEKYGQKFQ